MTDRVGDGLLVVDKPPGWTSHDVVGRARRLCGTRRVGHAGTLDPMATGVLVLGVNRATRLLTFLVGCDKAYAATIRLGVATTTDDADGGVLQTSDTSGLDPEHIRAALSRLTGPIQQVPSAVSAVKIDGVRSYARVRAGQQVELPARQVVVHRLELLELRHPQPGRHTGPCSTELDVSVEVSSGTYVRALARDLGAAIGVGGHLTALRRTRVGDFTLADAVTLERMEARGAAAYLIPLATAATTSFPARRLTEQEAIDLRHGKRIHSQGPVAEPVAALDPDGGLVAMLEQGPDQARSLVVFPADEPADPHHPS